MAAWHTVYIKVEPPACSCAQAPGLTGCCGSFSS